MYGNFVDKCIFLLRNYRIFKGPKHWNREIFQSYSLPLNSFNFLIIERCREIEYRD